MFQSIVYRLSPYLTKWFDENYGRRLIRRFFNQIPSAEVVLDLGAGHGDDLMIAKSRFQNSKCWAVESYPPFVEELKANQIEVTSLNIERDRLPFDDGAVDVIIINQVLEHVKDVFWVLHECARVLKTGGSLIIGVPNLAAWHNRAILLLGVQPPAIATLSCHVRGYTREDLRQTIEKGSGGALMVKASRSAGFYPFPPVIARPLAALLPSLGWSVHLRVEKTRDYYGKFLQKAVEFNETNFYTGI